MRSLLLNIIMIYLNNIHKLMQTLVKISKLNKKIIYI